MNSFRIVEGKINDLEAFEKTVSELIADGYLPTGSPTVATVGAETRIYIALVAEDDDFDDDDDEDDDEEDDDE